MPSSIEVGTFGVFMYLDYCLMTSEVRRQSMAASEVSTLSDQGWHLWALHILSHRGQYLWALHVPQLLSDDVRGEFPSEHMPEV